MTTLKDYVNWGLTHCDKTASAEGVPLILEKCVKNKKMKQLEVYGNSVQNGTPSPDNPIEVESVGELVADTTDTNCGKYKIPVTVRGKNLYDSKSYPITQGYYIHSGNGSYNSNASFAATQNFIPCDSLQGKMITINHTGGSNPGIAFYNNNKGYLSGKANGSSANTSISVVVPNNAHYYRFCVQNSYADVAMVEYGNAPTDYEPYVEPITTNVYLNEPLRSADVLDFKAKKVKRIDSVEDVECELPILSAKTSVIEINTSILPSNIKGKYIKR